MSKKIVLLALAAISTTAFALPAAAMADDVPLHAIPTAKLLVTGGVASITDTNGFSGACEKSSGKVSWDSSTTGTLSLQFDKCVGKIGGMSFDCGTIFINTAPFHLLTLPNKAPGILITPPAGGKLAEFICGGFFKVTLGATGLIGTITSPPCGEPSSTWTIKFEASSPGMQKHKTVEGTGTEYNPTLNGVEAALEATITFNFPGSTKLECT